MLSTKLWTDKDSWSDCNPNNENVLNSCLMVFRLLTIRELCLGCVAPGLSAPNWIYSQWKEKKKAVATKIKEIGASLFVWKHPRDCPRLFMCAVNNALKWMISWKFYYLPSYHFSICVCDQGCLMLQTIHPPTAAFNENRYMLFPLW